jgi:DNA-binding NarL/FixJ family response regulator
VEVEMNSEEAGGQEEEHLTTREQAVMDLLAAGEDNRAIAHILAISSKTVEMHLSSVYQKLGVKGRVQAVIKYLRRDRSNSI